MITKEQEYIQVIGLPASGKTTYSHKWVEEDPKHRIRVNRDDIRRSLGPYWIPSRESLVTQIEDSMTLQALKDGYSVINDNTNFNPKYSLFNRNKEAIPVGVILKTVDFTDVSPQVCVRRDHGRSKSIQVGAKVIIAMAKKYLSDKYPINEKEEKHLLSKLKYDPRLTGQVQYDGNLPDCYIFDLDGTISLMDGRSAYDGESCGSDAPNHPVIDTLNKLALTTKIFLFSGRNGESAEQTVAWLDAFDICYSGLHMRQPKDQRKDSIIKEEMYNDIIKDKYNVVGIFDDRNMMVDHWRSMGLPCYQVFPGDF